MNKVLIHGSIEYVDCNLSKNEVNPFALVYLDQNFSYTDDKIVRAPLKAVGAVVPFVLEGYAKQVPASSAICIASFAHRKDQFGTAHKLDAGFATDTLENAIRARPSKSHPYTVDLPLIMYTVNRFQKGKVRLRIAGAMLGDLTFKPVRIGGDMRALEHVFADYYRSLGVQRQQMGETFRGTGGMDAPYDYSQAGFHGDGIPVPLVGYTINKLPEVNSDYWYNAFSVVMKRDDLLPSDWKLLNHAGKCRIMSHMLAYQASYSDYVADTMLIDTRKHPNEVGHEIGNELFWARYSGSDCEDKAGVIQCAHGAFVGHKFPADATRFGPLIELQQIARQYVPLLSLDVVNGAQASDTNVPLGAHMNVNFISLHEFQTRLGSKVAEQLPWQEDIDTTKTYPFLVAEGTGIYDATGYHDPAAQAKAYVYGNCRSLGPVKKPLGHERGETGAFFVGSLLGTTNYFINRGARIGTFYYASEAGTRGVLYSDMINNRKYSLVPQPQIPRQMLEHTLQKVAVRVPLLPCKLTTRKVDAGLQELTKVSAAVTKLNRPHATEHIAAPVYILSHLITPTLVQGFIHDVTRLTRVTKVSVHPEPVTDEITGYRVMVHVDTRPK